MAERPEHESFWKEWLAPEPEPWTPGKVVGDVVEVVTLPLQWALGWLD